MNCDPNALMESAKCYRCIPAGEQSAIKIYLLCQWANSLSGCEVRWTPENAIASWNDASGGHVGDWNAFSATADVSTVTSFDMTGIGIDSLTGLECMPLLNDLRISQNALTGTLNLSVCPLLAFVECGVNQLTGLDVSGLVNLLFLDAGVNQMSTAAINTILIDLDTNGAINGQADLNAQTPSAPPSQVGRNAAANLIADGWALTLDEINWAPATEVFSWTDGGGANAGNLAFFLANADFDTVTDLQSPGGGLVTSLTGLQGLISLSTLSASGEAIVTFDGRRMPSISGVAIGNNPNLTTLTFTAVTSLTSLSCFNSVVTTLVLTGCTSLTNLDCQLNAGLTAITGIGTCTALVALDCNTCDITGSLDLSGLANLTTVNCSVNANLTGLNVTGCVALITLTCSYCSIGPTINVSTCSSLFSISCLYNALTSLDFTSCPNLTSITCSYNLLTSLLITGTSLINIIFTNNSLTSINATGLASLTNLTGSNNLLTSVTLTGCTGLVNLTLMTNPLNSIDISPCTSLQLVQLDYCSLTTLDCSSNTSLNDVHVFDNSMLTAGVDAVLSTLVISSVNNAGIVDVDGTNQSPTGGAANVSKLALEAGAGGGWSVTIT